MVKESEIQKQILDYLAALEIFAWRNLNGPLKIGTGKMVPNRTPGSPDILGVLPCGRSLQIEVKSSEKAKRSDAQIDWIARAKVNNAIAFFAWSIECVNKELLFCNKDCLSCVSCLRPDSSDMI